MRVGLSVILAEISGIPSSLPSAFMPYKPPESRAIRNIGRKVAETELGGRSRSAIERSLRIVSPENGHPAEEAWRFSA
jgi:hypothetical protein